MVCAEVAKNPSAAMEVDIGCSLLLLTLSIQLGSWLKDSNGDLASLYRALLFCDTMNIGTDSATIDNQVVSGILSKVVDWNFVGMQTACIVFVVVFHINWIVAVDQLWRNTIMQWLINFGYFEVMQGRVARWVLFL